MSELTADRKEAAILAAHNEMVALCDTEGKIVGEVQRAKMRREGLPHMATYIFVIDSDNTHILVQQRSAIKDFCPGQLDLAAGGVVSAGETDVMLSAHRELEEELGISGVPLTEKGTLRWQTEDCLCFGRLFEVRVPRCTPLRLQDTEVDLVVWLPIDTVCDMIGHSDDDGGCIQDGRDELRAKRLRHVTLHPILRAPFTPDTVAAFRQVYLSREAPTRPNYRPSD
ncbi:MAG: hypothetical protein MHM6MM_007997 [Cercozoa sp. M6MM]